MIASSAKKFLSLATLVLAAAGLSYVGWLKYNQRGADAQLLVGNGRLEAVTIDVATRTGGRVDAVHVQEGDFVQAGQPLVTMDLNSLKAGLAEAQAGLAQTEAAVQSARSQIVLRQSDHDAMLAVIKQRQGELTAISKRLQRTRTLFHQGALPKQALEDEETRLSSAQAALSASQAQSRAAEAAVAAAKSQLIAVMATVESARATLTRLQTDLSDGVLKAPRDGRIQYVVAQPGEVVGPGGKVLNLLDISDVSMNFFAPETVAGRIALGSEVRIVLDIAPKVAVPAKVSFVADTAQFTPKTVETANERQKLMFRVRARIDPVLLKKYQRQVKVGLPGVAYLKLDPQAPWPEHLQHVVTP